MRQCFAVFAQLLWSSSNAALIINGSDEITTTRPNEAPEFCFAGHFLDVERNECRPCPEGHFMPDLIHAQLRCYPCERILDDSSEVVWAPCTKTQPTTIGCREGFYLKLAAVSDKRLVKCYPCTNCSLKEPSSYEIHSCGKSFDAACCPRPHMTAVKREGESGYDCQDQNFGKVSPTQISTRSISESDHLELKLDLVSFYYHTGSKEKSTVAYAINSQVGATGQYCDSFSTSSAFILGASIGLNVVFGLIILRLWLERSIKMSSAKVAKARLLQLDMPDFKKDSENPLFYHPDSGHDLHVESLPPKSDPQTTHHTPYKARSGREVEKPHKYTG